MRAELWAGCRRLAIALVACIPVTGCSLPDLPDKIIRPALTDASSHVPGNGIVIYDVEIFTSLRYQSQLKRPPTQRWANEDLSVGFWAGYVKDRLDVNPEATRARDGIPEGIGFFAYSLPPGTYHLQMSDFAGIGFWTKASDRPTEITFRSVPGEVTYIGTLSYRFDIPPGSYAIRIKDRFDQVSGATKARFGEVGPIRKRLARYEPNAVR